MFVSCGTVTAFVPPDISLSVLDSDMFDNGVINPPSSKVPSSVAVPFEALETEQLLKNLVIPACNYRDITLRLADPGVEIPEVVNTNPPNYKIDDERQFWVSNVDTGKYYSIIAKLVYKTEHAYIWLEKGAKTQLVSLKKAADLWDKKYYPTDREFFGSEWSPGVDNDARINWLISDKMGEHAAGYYSSMDEYSKLVNKYSNEMEMFYLSSENNPAAVPYFNGVLAHEFAHMIQWYHHSNQANWIDEGLAELAVQINGLDPGLKRIRFAYNPDIQLNSWPELDSATAYYGAAYMFMSYYLDRFGKIATQALISSTSYSTAAIDEALKDKNITFNQVFADWTIANYINNSNIGNGEYAYRTIQPTRFKACQKIQPSDYPIDITDSVAQYGTDYIEISGHTDLEVKFTGDSTVGLTAVTAHSGKYMWWGGSNNASDATLTRTFDLSGAEKATLTFWTSHDIEEGYDYVFVEASVDGKHWTTLQGTNTVIDNPNGANYGFGYTGTNNGWVQEKINLSQYAGNKVQIRFEYITDAGLTKSGFFLDDIAIPEIGYMSNVEKNNGGWTARGFVRNANILPQYWSIQLITVGLTTTVEKLPVTQNATGNWTVHFKKDDTRYTVLVISGLTPITLERPSYKLVVNIKK